MSITHLSICPSVPIENIGTDTEEGSIKMAEILSTETGGIGMDLIDRSAN